MSNSTNQTTNSLMNPLTLATISFMTSSTNSHSPQNGLDNPTSAPEQPRVLPLVLANYTVRYIHYVNRYIHIYSGKLTTRFIPLHIL